MTFSAALASAFDRPGLAEASSATQDLVIKELGRLAPDVRIEKTDYFNHSFVPDLILNWGSKEEPRARHLFLRGSVRDDAFRQDLDFLSDRDALFLGLLDAAPDGAAVPPEPVGALVTPSAAVDELDEALEVEARASQATSPLVREGEGYLDAEAADDLGKSYLEALNALDRVHLVNLQPDEAALEPFDVKGTAGSIQHALSTLDRYLREAGQLEVEQGLQSQWIQEGLEPEEFPGRTTWDVRTMSRVELGRLLAALLSTKRPVSAQTWVTNAGHLSVEELGRVIGRPFFGGRFDELARTLLYGWVAQWAWVESMPGAPLERQYAWLTDGRLVGLLANDIRIWFAGDGRHFVGKDADRPLPALEAAARWLDNPAVIGVWLTTRFDELHYMRRSGTASALRRVRALTDAQGEYFIQRLTTQVPGQDWTADVQLDRGLINTEAATPVAVLAEMAYSYFSKSAFSVEDLGAFLHAGGSELA